MIRLLCAGIASALIGLNRSEHGRPAGLRTTMLVCFAAAASMIQANLLLATNGKTEHSFAVADVLRLPLGVLSGMGFIGAGAILRKGEMILGVTTAATLWFVTAMGLCFGGGHLALGWAMAGIGVGVLALLKRVEVMLPQDRYAQLSLMIDQGGPAESDVRSRLRAAGYSITGSGVIYIADSSRCKLNYSIRWRRRGSVGRPPDIVHELATTTGVRKIQWRAQGTPSEAWAESSTSSAWDDT
ncbi:MAG TPA: MgtC/SapB family protein [Pirellulales bacterium]|nr:MgtC/SapB family protein [Pirellulales bacterium]